ncbi:hypothetical protein V6Z12_D13G214900 [Gossypium hirsutum]
MGNTASIPYTREKARALPSLSPSSLFSPIRKSSPSPPVDPPPPIHLLTSGPPQLTAPPNSKIRAKRRKNLGFQILRFNPNKGTTCASGFNLCIPFRTLQYL